jgi:hypothetical protein
MANCRFRSTFGHLYTNQHLQYTPAKKYPEENRESKAAPEFATLEDEKGDTIYRENRTNLDRRYRLKSRRIKNAGRERKREREKLWNVLNFGNDTPSHLCQPTIETTVGEVALDLRVAANSMESLVEIQGQRLEICFAQVASVKLLDGFPDLFE